MDNLYETAIFTISVGTLENDKEPQYLVKSKKTGVVEFCNASFYFARDWARQFTKALEEQDMEIAEEGVTVTVEAGLGKAN